MRSFIPHRAHASIGVLGVVGVATSCLIDGSAAAEVATIPAGATKTLSMEHPSGEMTCVMTMAADGSVASAAMLRTARKLMDEDVFA